MSTNSGIGFSSAELARFSRQFKQFSAKKTKKLQDITMLAAYNILQGAKENVPRYQTRLHNSLKVIEARNKLSAKVKTNIEYAAFIEFGTKSKAKIPPEISQYASQFRGGSSGNLDDFLEQIYKWAKKKNIGGKFTKSGKASKSKKSVDAVSQTAWLIAMSILKKGIKAQPFLYPAFKAEIPKYISAIKTVMNQEEK